MMLKSGTSLFVDVSPVDEVSKINDDEEEDGRLESAASRPSEEAGPRAGGARQRARQQSHDAMTVYRPRGKKKRMMA